MDELFHELNLYLNPSVAANMGNSAEQNTAALIASSMNSEYEDDWSTPPSSYRDSHTPLTNSSISSNSADQKLGLGDNVINHRMVHNGSMILSMDVNEEEAMTEENLPLLTLNEYEEIRNYTDLDLLEAAAPTILNEINAFCDNIPPVTQEFSSTDITPVKSKPKKSELLKKKKKKKVVSTAPLQPQAVSSNSTQTSLLETSVTPGINAENAPHDDSSPLESVLRSPICADLSAEFSQTTTNSTEPLPEPGNDSNTFKANVWTAESVDKDEGILKKRFIKKIIPPSPPNSADLAFVAPDSKIIKAPSYLTLFPIRCKEYPMVYSCNHCARIFTSVRGGQLHDCVKKRRGRKAGTKLKQSYTGTDRSDLSQV